MIFVSIIGITTGVKVIKNLRRRWIYQVSTIDYTLKIFSIGSILSKTFFDYLNISEENQVKLMAYKLKGGASTWWEQLQYNHQ